VYLYTVLGVVLLFLALQLFFFPYDAKIGFPITFSVFSLLVFLIYTAMTRESVNEVLQRIFLCVVFVFASTVILSCIGSMAAIVLDISSWVPYKLTTPMFIWLVGDACLLLTGFFCVFESLNLIEIKEEKEFLDEESS
jgi:predicted Na+-dependent transporter